MMPVDARTSFKLLLCMFIASLLTAGCASIPGLGKKAPEAGFDPGIQAELLRKKQEMQAATRSVAPEPGPPTLAERLREGDALRKDGDYAAAMWVYLRAHEAESEDPAPIGRIASLRLLDDPARAQSMFLDLIEDHPESAAARTGLGLAHIALDAWDEARAAFEAALEIDAEAPIAQANLGVVLDRAGEYAAARRAYRAALEVAPQYYEALNNLGVSYIATEEFAEAAETLERASRLESRDAAVFNNLGFALGRLGRYDAALKAFRKAGTSQAAHNNLGYVAHLNGDYERALEAYEAALLERGSDRLKVLRNLLAARDARDAGGSPAPR